ncbi:TetR/AcrR family transcriptional regulator [Kribbia dieselivorans]|uniref:TetR/AcrR family transcriptional regulator n=1 Tax=Kribbia dieselivorans TaxID=331526 RepID=UPI0009F923C1|nr:TetR/AcrR family transcriptional regulator [Kribbia dieselivorans]
MFNEGSVDGPVTPIAARVAPGLRRSSVVRPGDDPAAARILDAAVTAFGQRGYHGASIRDVAQLAQVSPGSLYNYFATKQDILFTIMDRGISRLVEVTEQALFDAPADPVSRLRAVVGTHVRNHARGTVESLIGNSELRSLEPGNRAVIVAKRDAQQRHFERVIRDGAERGVFDVADPPLTAIYLASACTATATWYSPDGALSVDELVERFENLALATVGAQR